MRVGGFIIQFAVVLAVCNVQIANASDAPVQYAGVNIAGGEFTAEKLPGRYGYDYTYPGPEHD